MKTPLIVLPWLARMLATFAVAGLPALPVRAQTDIIIDNPNATLVGSWAASTYQSGYYGTNYLDKTAGTGTATVTWTPTIPTTSVYDVSYWLPSGGSDRVTNAPFTVTAQNGTVTIPVSEQTSGGAWTKLGTFDFANGTSGNVQLTDNATGTYVIADAVRFTQSGAILDTTGAVLTGGWSTSTYEPNYYGTDYAYIASGTGSATARWTPNLPNAGTYNVFVWLPTGPTDRATNAPFTISSSGGTNTYPVNEQGSGGQWVLLGAQTFAAGTGGYVQLSNAANGTYVVAGAVKFSPAAASSYTLRTDVPKQTILGLGVELQCDSIGSGNDGLPTSTDSVPHDLIASEKTRFYTEMLTGFRYLRLALGLYLRGLTTDNKDIIQRFDGQVSDIASLISQSGIEGVDAEYWSPAPAWKSNSALIAGSLNQYDTTFLSNFGSAVVQDLNYLTTNGIPVKMWGLQNEPTVTASYSSCTYTDQQYYSTFKIVAPMVRTAFPNVLIHNDSQAGQYGKGSALIQADSTTLSYVNAWTHHRIGADSNDEITNQSYLNANTYGKPVFNDEFEYLSGGTSQARMMNTAQSIMNWMVFENAPTWFWLHALKPTTNSESEGYGLGLWRPADDTDFTHYPTIATGHYDYLPTNYNAVAGFVKYLPWNSVRYQVDEQTVETDERILAWKAPAGKYGFALTNRSTTAFTFVLALGTSMTLSGHHYDATSRDVTAGSVTGTTVSIVLQPGAIEFWTQN